MSLLLSIDGTALFIQMRCTVLTEIESGKITFFHYCLKTIVPINSNVFFPNGSLEISATTSVNRQQVVETYNNPWVSLFGLRF